MFSPHPTPKTHALDSSPSLQSQYAEEEAGEKGLASQCQGDNCGNHDSHRARRIQIAKRELIPEPVRVSRAAQAGENQDDGHDQTELQREVIECSIKPFIFRQQPFADRKDFSEYCKEDRLKTNDDCHRGVEKRMHIESYPANDSWAG